MLLFLAGLADFSHLIDFFTKICYNIRKKSKVKEHHNEEAFVLTENCAVL